MPKKMLTQFTPNDLQAAKATLASLRETTPTQPNEGVSTYLQRAGMTDAKTRQRLIWAIAVLGHITRTGTKVADVERWMVWSQDGSAISEIQVIHHIQATRKP